MTVYFERNNNPTRRATYAISIIVIAKTSTVRLELLVSVGHKVKLPHMHKRHARNEKKNPKHIIIHTRVVSHEKSLECRVGCWPIRNGLNWLACAPEADESVLIVTRQRAGQSATELMSLMSLAVRRPQVEFERLLLSLL